MTSERHNAFEQIDAQNCFDVRVRGRATIGNIWCASAEVHAYGRQTTYVSGTRPMPMTGLQKWCEDSDEHTRREMYSMSGSCASGITSIPARVAVFHGSRLRESDLRVMADCCTQTRRAYPSAASEGRDFPAGLCNVPPLITSSMHQFGMPRVGHVALCRLLVARDSSTPSTRTAQATWSASAHQDPSRYHTWHQRIPSKDAMSKNFSY